mgnify:CR=1 FL=1
MKGAKLTGATVSDVKMIHWINFLTLHLLLILYFCFSFIIIIICFTKYLICFDPHFFLLSIQYVLSDDAKHVNY